RDQDLVPAIDVEETAGQSQAAIIRELTVCLTKVEQLFQRTPIIYTGKGFWNSVFPKAKPPGGPKPLATDANFFGYQLWVAATDNPAWSPVTDADRALSVEDKKRRAEAFNQSDAFPKSFN